MRDRYPENAAGPFYVERDLCLICRAPEHEAPELLGFVDADEHSHCYFKRQPITTVEVDAAINALCVACCGALRYGGDDERLIERIVAAGIETDRVDALGQ